MDQELRDLVDQMRQLIPVLQGMNKPPGTAGNQPADNMTRGVDRMVVALGQLVVKLDATKKSQRQEDEAVKKFANAVERTAKNIDNENKEREAATAALEKEIKAREEATRRSKLSQQGREQEDKDQALKKAKDEAEQRNRDTKLSIEQNRKSSSSSKELFDSLSSTGGSAEILKNKFLNLGGDSLVAQSGLQVFSAGLGGTAKSLTTFASGLLNGERGAQLSAKALNDFATPILDAAGAIGTLLTVLSFIPGPIGFLTRGARIAGAAVFGLGSAAGKAALKLNELGAKQLDTLVKSFNDASGAGVSLAGGLEGTLDLMHTLNMTTADAAQFQEMLSKNNKQLALLGGTAGTGAKRFAEVSGALVKSNIGQTFEIMGITQQEQREAALLYMSIQARTGQMQLKNTEKLIEESARFVYELDQAAQLTGTTRREQQEAREAAMAETRFRAAVIDARQRGDKEEQARLETAQRAASMLKALGDERGFLGVLQQAAGQGALTTPEAIAAEQTYRISEILNKPNVTEQEMLAHFAATAKLNQQTFAATNRLIGGIDILQTSIVGMDNAVLRQTNVAEEAARAGFTGPDAITKYLEEEKKKRKQPGGDLGLMINAGRAQQAAAMTMEQGISTYNIAADINKAASETFAKAVEEFGKITGVKPVPGGTPTFGGVPVESGVRLPPTVAAATAKVEQAKTTLKGIEAEIKEQEKKLAFASTNAEKDKAEAEIKKLKSQLSDAKIAKNAAELGQKSVERSTGLSEANQRMKSGLGPPPMDAEAKERFKQQLKSGANPTGGASSAPAATGTPVSAKPAVAVISAGPGFTTVQTVDGTNQRREGVRNWRNNNPGNIEYGQFSQRMGAIGSDGRFAVFPTLEMGTKAKEELLFGEQSNYKNLSIANAINRYAPPSENNTQAYIAAVTSALGVSDNTILAQLSSSDRSKFLETISRVEGFKEGTVLQARNGGVFQGPMSGYPAVLHGKEAVIPLKNGAVPVMMPALDELVSSNRAVDAQVQVLRNEMGSMMRELTTAIQTMKETGSQERMIQLLESMSRSQQSTATATQRMAQLASN
jgi:hypothetical protein